MSQVLALATSVAPLTTSFAAPMEYLSSVKVNVSNKLTTATTKASKSLSTQTGLSEDACHSIILGGAVIASLVTTIGVLTEHKRRNFPKCVPGKLGLPWLGSTVQFLSGVTDFLATSHAEHGDIFKMVMGGEQFLCVRGDELLEQTAGSYKMDVLENGVIPAARILFGENSLLGANHAQHKLLKRNYTKIMGQVPVHEYFPNVIPVILKRFESWASASQAPQYINAFPEIKEATLAANLTMLLGANVIKDEEIPELSYQLHAYAKGIMSLPLEIPGTQFAEAVRCANAVKERVRNLATQRHGATDKSALSLFVNTIDSETGKPFESKIIEQNLLVALFASQDTTVAALCKVIAVLAERPDLVHAIREEWGYIDKPISSADISKLTAADLLSKPVTRAIFLEAVRETPPISFTIRKAIKPVRLTTSKGLDIVVPPGMKIICSLEATMKTSQQLPIDPKVFNHVRFLGTNMKALEQSKTYGFCAFGGGYRLCPGKNMAEIIGLLGTTIAALMYDLKLEAPLTFVDTFGPRPKDDRMMVAFVRRS